MFPRLPLGGQSRSKLILFVCLFFLAKEMARGGPEDVTAGARSGRRVNESAGPHNWVVSNACPSCMEIQGNSRLRVEECCKKTDILLYFTLFSLFLNEI